MIRLAISVEGQTEEEFVKQILVSHLRRKQIETTPILLGRARGTSRGGNVSTDRMVRDMVALLASYDAVTSLVDYYGFRDKGEKTVEDLEKCLLNMVFERVNADWYSEKVVPYVQRHEFEALLFSDVQVFANHIEFPGKGIDVLEEDCGKFTTPEDINDHPETSPSKRIVRVLPRYKKVLHGPELAGQIGLDRIRAACPRFNAWITHLESFGAK
ncbi:MAG: DUF4276 family protein [Bryobacterales bacterium]|nr:DUF4276 family protein [Bryobacterales bacterium]